MKKTLLISFIVLLTSFSMSVHANKNHDENSRRGWDFSGLTCITDTGVMLSPILVPSLYGGLGYLLGKLVFPESSWTEKAIYGGGILYGVVGATLGIISDSQGSLTEDMFGMAVSPAILPGMLLAVPFCE